MSACNMEEPGTQLLRDRVRMGIQTYPLLTVRCQMSGTLLSAHCVYPQHPGLQGTGESMTQDPEAHLEPGTRAVTEPTLSFSNFKIGMFSLVPGTPRLRGGVVQAKGEQRFVAGMDRQVYRQVGDAEGQASRDRKGSLTRSV